MPEWFIYTVWPTAMLVIGFWMKGDAMWRTWFALMFSCAGGWLSYLWLADATSVPVAGYYILFDFLAAMLVLNRPRGRVQSMICWTLISMMTVQIAFVWSGQRNPEFVGHWNFGIGWVQAVLLLSWGLNKRYGIYNSFDRIASAFCSSSKAGK
jgi:hypothetical protein